ncbi:MAG: CBS domain-containing protein [Candidatus Bathyarchaeia archaeon]|jgi:CBS domain-containing protein
MAGMLSVRDAMTRDVKVVREDTTMQEVIATMLKFDISSVVVVQKDRPIGLITHKDIMERVLQMELLPAALTARNVMSASLVTIGEDASLEEAARIMVKKGFKKLIVVQDGKLVGLITSMDIAREEPKLTKLFEDLLKYCPKN